MSTTEILQQNYRLVGARHLCFATATRVAVAGPDRVVTYSVASGATLPLLGESDAPTTTDKLGPICASTANLWVLGEKKLHRWSNAEAPVYQAGTDHTAKRASWIALIDSAADKIVIPAGPDGVSLRSTAGVLYEIGGVLSDISCVTYDSSTKRLYCFDRWGAAGACVQVDTTANTLVTLYRFDTKHNGAVSCLRFGSIVVAGFSDKTIVRFDASNDCAVLEETKTTYEISAVVPYGSESSIRYLTEESDPSTPGVFVRPWTNGIGLGAQFVAISDAGDIVSINPADDTSTYLILQEDGFVLLTEDGDNLRQE